MQTITYGTYQIASVTADNLAGDLFVRTVAKQTDATLSPFTLSEMREEYSEESEGQYLLESNAVTDYTFKVDNSGTHNFKADFSKNTLEYFYYDGGFSNNEWFRTYVFDRSFKENEAKFIIDVQTVTIEELNQLGEAELEQVGLLY